MVVRNDLFAGFAGNREAFDRGMAACEKIRIHRATLLKVDAVKELHTWFGGRLLVRPKDGRTELHVARDRSAEVRAKLGL